MVVAALRRRITDPNTLVAEAAQQALRGRLRQALKPSDPPMPETVVPGATLVEVHGDSYFFEGPTWDPKAQRLYFTARGGPTTRILRLESNGHAAVWIEDAKGVHGTYLSQHGRLLGAQAHAHRVVSYAFGADGPGDERILAEDTTWNQPNDLCQAPNGDIYFTDPDSGKRQTSGVYRLAPDGEPVKVAGDMAAPNGVITSLDGKTLYVGDSHWKWWRRYAIEADGSLDPGRVFFISDTEAQRAPDGMTIDEHGNLYLTGGGGVWAVTPDGQPLGMVPTPQLASNVTFGGRDGTTLYITCDRKVYSVRMRVRGGFGRPPK